MWVAHAWHMQVGMNMILYSGGLAEKNSGDGQSLLPSDPTNQPTKCLKTKSTDDSSDFTWLLQKSVGIRSEKFSKNFLPSDPIGNSDLRPTNLRNIPTYKHPFPCLHHHPHPQTKKWTGVSLSTLASFSMDKMSL